MQHPLNNIRLIDLTHKIKIMLLFLCVIFIGFSLPVSAESYSSSVFKFQHAMAKNGRVESQYKLGNMYASGRGVQKDLIIATEWYEKSAQQNYLPAKNRLVFLDIKRKGYSNKKYNKWLKNLYTLVVEGNAEASMLLGDMFKEGVVVKKSINKARYYYKRAVSFGLVDAETELEFIDEMLATQKKQRLKRDEEIKKRSAQRKRDKQIKLASDVRIELEKKRLEEKRLNIEKAKIALEIDSK